MKNTRNGLTFMIVLFLLLAAGVMSYAQPKIHVISLSRSITMQDNAPYGSLEIQAEFRIPLPEGLLTMPNVNELATTYQKEYGITRIDSGGIAVFTLNKSFGVWVQDSSGNNTNVLIDDEYIQSFLEGEYNRYSTILSAFQVWPFDAIMNKKWDGTSWGY